MSFTTGPRLVAALLGGALALPVLAAGPSVPVAQVTSASRHDESRPMRDIIKTLPPIAPVSNEVEPREIPNRLRKSNGVLEGRDMQALRRVRQQTAPTGTPAPSVDLTFEAQDYLSCGAGCLPPDTNGDVSPTHYIQWVNSSWAVYNKTTGAKISGPTAGNSFFAGFGGECEAPNDGDPIALWDDAAQRWVMSQFVTDPVNTSIGGAQCVAVSTTSDPLGSYYRYEFDFPNFGDYPHFGIWRDASHTQDAYLLVTHEFNGNPFVGAAFIALQRDEMLAGRPAKMIRFGGNDAYGALPIHLDGNVDAPARACPVFVHFDPAASDYLFWDMCIDWNTTANTTLSATAQRVGALSAYVPNYTSVAQPGTSSALDSFGTNLMYRAAARGFPEGAPWRVSLAINHAVVGGGAQGGVKWVQFGLQPPAGYDTDHIFIDGFGDTPVVLQQPLHLTKAIHDEGTYAPDTKTRWMGSVAVDLSGDVGLGFSIGGSTQNPDLRTTGRRLGDPAGQMRDEVSCTGLGSTGSQTSTSGRWGDYASMSVDPVDQCTFWFTSEYHPVTSSGSWHTRVCRFKFAECGQPDFALVADTPKRLEICGATASGDPQYKLRAGVLNGYSSAVTLAATSLPATTSASFSLNPLPATPDKSTLTLTGGAALASGEYAFSVSATDGTITRTLPLELGVSSAAAVAPTLTAPADAATAVVPYPTFTWSASAGALEYTIEVASDAAFATIVTTSTLSGTSFTPSTPLAAGTYYWRVTPHNYCGAGAASVVRSFTTAAPGACPAGTTLTNVYADAITATSTWTAGGTGGGSGTAPIWKIVTTPPAGTTTSVSYAVRDNPSTSDRTLDSPAIVIPAGAQRVYLSFDAYHSFETDDPSGCWDAAALEVKAGAGSFTYLDFSHMYTDPYDGTISTGAPLAGRKAWCRVSGTPKHSIVSLSEFAGQTVQVRFRATSDSNSTAAAPNGFYLDNVSVDVCQ